MHGMNIDKSKLPGAAKFYTEHPPTIQYYDIFYFETKMRDMIQECMEQIRQSAKEDKEKTEIVKQNYDNVKIRIEELEDFIFPLVVPQKKMPKSKTIA